MCPLSTVQFTCIADDNVLMWREFDSDSPITYTTFGSKVINDTGMAGVFRTVLTSISGTTLISTATIDSVSLQKDNGRNISCADISGTVFWQLVKVEGIASYNAPHIILQHRVFINDTDTPPAPSNLAVTIS